MYEYQEDRGWKRKTFVVGRDGVKRLVQRIDIPETRLELRLLTEKAFGRRP